MIIVLLFLAILFWQTRPLYYSSQWFRIRMLLYVGLTAYGVIPALHWISLNGGLQTPVVQVRTAIDIIRHDFDCVIELSSDSFL